MTIREFYRKYGLNRTHSLLSIIFMDNDTITIPVSKLSLIQFIRGRRCKRISFEFPEDNVIEILSKVNKEVKHPSCPNNLRNRFYRKKKIFIQHLLSKGMVDEIIESEKYYNFIVNGYSFHQPKAFFPCGIKKITGTEVYVPTETEEVFSLEDYKKCMLCILSELIKK